MAMNSRREPKKKVVASLGYFIDKYLKKMGYFQIVIWEWTDKQSRYGHSYHYYKNGETNLPHRLLGEKFQLMQIVYSKHLNGRTTKSIKLEVV